MKLLLVAVNAKYIHSNLAVYSLRAYAARYADHIGLLEMTINHPEEDILKAVYCEKADIVAFSCYIWNIAVIRRIASQLKKVHPQVRIWFGGPEVSYDAKCCLMENVCLDGIMIGEGEQTFLELAAYYIEGNTSLADIRGLAFKQSARINTEEDTMESVSGKTEASARIAEVTETSARTALPLDCIPFPYDNITDFENRIIYYESSRGCPYSCSYCLSSIDKKVRFRSTELVKKELKQLLEHRVPQVKFVDRTFNCNHEHALELWSFLKNNDNGITNFHFEIAAELLTEEELELLASLRPGQVQLEIGVQSMNPDTIGAVHRHMEADRLKKNVLSVKMGNNIHQHLDLIAGLPLENEESFENSFNEVYAMKPDQLQLGFLKVLKGSAMERESTAYGIVYREEAPYEVLYTRNLSYDALLRLKGVCEMLEVYYNSNQFVYSIGYLEHYYASPMKLYRALHAYYERKQLSGMNHSRMRRYEILLDFFKEEIILSKEAVDAEAEALLKELLIYDLFLREKLKTRPPFAPQKPTQGGIKELYHRLESDRGVVHIEHFNYDLTAAIIHGKMIRKERLVMFDYSKRNPLSRAAMVSEITQSELQQISH